MEPMSNPTLPHGQLPPIPEGSGIMPIAENRIARGPHPELLDAVPEGFRPLEPETTPVLNDSQNDPLDDALEQTYRRVLARAFGLAGCALLLAAATAYSVTGNSSFHRDFASSALSAQLLFRAVFVIQLLLVGLCSRYVEKLSIAPAAILMFAYAVFSALEFSALVPSSAMAVALMCAGLLYVLTALWAYARHSDLALPVTGIFMILAGGAILTAVNLLLRASSLAWSLSSIAVVVFTLLGGYYAQQIRDFYQDFDDDNAQGWKASVLGALLLLINSVNLYLLVASFLPRDDATIPPTG